MILFLSFLIFMNVTIYKCLWKYMFLVSTMKSFFSYHKQQEKIFIPKQVFEYNKTITMTHHFLKDQMKCKSNPSFYQLLIEKSQIRGKKWSKTFLSNKRPLLFILRWRNTKFSKKQKIFYQTLSLNLIN